MAKKKDTNEAKSSDKPSNANEDDLLLVDPNKFLDLDPTNSGSIESNPSGSPSGPAIRETGEVSLKDSLISAGISKSKIAGVLSIFDKFGIESLEELFALDISSLDSWIDPNIPKTLGIVAALRVIHEKHHSKPNPMVSNLSKDISISSEDVSKALGVKQAKNTVADIVHKYEEKSGYKLLDREYPDQDAVNEVENSTDGDNTISYVDLSKLAFVPIHYRKMAASVTDKFELQNIEGELSMVKKKGNVYITTLHQLSDHIHNYFIILAALGYVSMSASNRYLAELRELAVSYDWSIVKEYDIKRRMRAAKLSSMNKDPDWGTRCNDTFSSVVTDKIMLKTLYSNENGGKGFGKGKSKGFMALQKPCTFIASGQTCPYGNACRFNHNIQHMSKGKGGKAKGKTNALNSNPY